WQRCVSSDRQWAGRRGGGHVQRFLLRSMQGHGAFRVVLLRANPPKAADHQEQPAAQDPGPRPSTPAARRIDPAARILPIRLGEGNGSPFQLLPCQLVEFLVGTHIDAVFIGVRAWARRARACCNSCRAWETCHFEVPALMPSIPAISAWLKPSMANRLKTLRDISGTRCKSSAN